MKRVRLSRDDVSNLCGDILLYVYSFLSTADLMKGLLVCRHWFDVLSSDHAWRRRVQRILFQQELPASPLWKWVTTHLPRVPREKDDLILSQWFETLPMETQSFVCEANLGMIRRFVEKIVKSNTCSCRWHYELTLPHGISCHFTQAKETSGITLILNNMVQMSHAGIPWSVFLRSYQILSEGLCPAEEYGLLRVYHAPVPPEDTHDFPYVRADVEDTV